MLVTIHALDQEKLLGDICICAAKIVPENERPKFAIKEDTLPSQEQRASEQRQDRTKIRNGSKSNLGR